ncbi:hypothetical protein XYCOK13_29980 [Xylanibacillus composti]|uniref:Rod shape-determining protein MreD n=1 Tax=Xylanibacillus composti TaxID=1572762 RepID=A0A8J4M2X3_9BACL|nr:rod shape-determining protein MreD [Xylanibacillus composti]GIQ70174.1 hypothetical protein XYCOK13_29980 [Xylanibacillus composti]
MKRTAIWWIMLLLFLLEGGLMPWLIPPGLQSQISPHLVLIVVIFCGFFVGRHFALAAGLLFGFLHDIIYYGYMLGLYAFAAGLTGYGAGLFPNRSHWHVLHVLAATAGGLVFFDGVVYLMYTFFAIHEETWLWLLLHRILPSLAFNLLMALLLYVPIRTLLERSGTKSKQEESG